MNPCYPLAVFYCIDVFAWSFQFGLSAESSF